jgi:2-polyprenyl-6-hydroxyphenyl methylase/3-demethylubiquinone-9 3-methyltransferase
MGSHAAELASGDRFDFGANWARFLLSLSEERIAEATHALQEMLGLESLTGRTFLDAGSGSGLTSLAARRLGATVRSFDYDPRSVACTAELRDRYCPSDPLWTVEAGSILDERFLRTLGRFDVVCSWGVLHHTGRMWTALSHAATLVAPNGQLFIALYNDQGWISRYWLGVKTAYNKSPVMRPLIVAAHAPYLLGARYVVRAVRGRRKLERGMSYWHDMIDWLGGLPFEVSTPLGVTRYVSTNGFVLQRQKTCGRRMGCNEFVFRRETS